MCKDCKYLVKRGTYYNCQKLESPQSLFNMAAVVMQQTIDNGKTKGTCPERKK